MHVSEPTLDYHIDSTTEGLNIFIYILYLLKLTALPVHVSEPTLDYHIDSTTEGLNIFIYISVVYIELVQVRSVCMGFQANCPASARI